MSDTEELIAFLKQKFVVKNRELIAYNGADSCVEIPNNVQIIWAGAFYECDEVTEVELHEKIMSIERAAFSHYRNLSVLTVDENSKKYDSRENCNAIIESRSNVLIRGCDNAAILDWVNCIGNHAFDYCRNMTNRRIPESIKNIGFGAFLGCLKLLQVTIPSSVTSIGTRRLQIVRV